MTGRLQKEIFPLDDRPVKATLSVTHRCNLACTYCYSGRPLHMDMSYSTAQKAVDFVLARTPPRHKITFYFFGGEPLLCFELIKHITAYIRRREAEAYRQIGFAITSNGILLTPEILNFFSREQFQLCVSIDGIEPAHNRHRRDPAGLPTFQTVLGKLCMAMAYLPNIQVNAVYGPETLPYLVESASFLSAMGVSAVHLSPDIKARWQPEHYVGIGEIFKQLADDYVDAYQHGHEIAMQPIDSKLIVLLKDGYDAADTCRATESDWSFAPGGNIYGCERLIGEDTRADLCLGNVDTGIVVEPRRQRRCRDTLLDQACRQCEVSKYCMNWCACSNYHMTGDPRTISSFLCESEKAVIRASGSVLSRLQENGCFLDHMIAYMQAA